MSAPAGWMSDPTDRHQHRYWDGSHWTTHVSDAGAQAVDPPVWSPPVGTTAAWYSDPSGRHRHRYWDGSQWTKNVANEGEQGIDPPDLAEPLPSVGLDRLAEAKAFMAEWVDIVGQASDPVFWGALARFGRIGDASQFPNTHSGNIQIFNVAETRFKNDFHAMFDWPWRNWLAIAKKANEVGDRELAVRVFFFAWTIQNQVTFDMNVSAEVGFQKPASDTFKAIAAEALAAATGAPADFAVVERAIEAPVTRENILRGTSQILGVAPPDAALMTEGAAMESEPDIQPLGPTETRLPADVLNQLGAFGEASWEAKVSSRPVTDPRFTWERFFAKAAEALRANPSQAVGEIHTAASGDQFAQFGGYSLIAEFDASTADARYLELMDASLQMMFDRKLSSGHLNRYEADRWIATHGDLRTSFDRIVEVAPPPPDHAAGVTLSAGETLMVATMGPGALDNQFWIERTSVGTYGAFSMRQWESGDVTLTRCEEEGIGRWDTVEGVLQSLGSYLGTRPFWAHDQLHPYFTQRRNI